MGALRVDIGHKKRNFASAYQPTGLDVGEIPQAANDNCYLYLASECTHGVCGSHSRSPALLALTARGDLTYDGAGLMSAAHSTSASWRYTPSDNVQDYAGTNELDQYGSVDMGDGAGPQDQVHDAAGNLTSSGAGRTYTYNSENQMTRAQGPGLDMEYWYDSEGRRERSLDHVANTEVFHQHLGQMHPKGTSSLALGAEVGDYSVCRMALVSGACPATNTIGTGKVIAHTPLFRIILGQNIDERIAYHDVDGDDLSFYLTNHQGSTISMTTETGTQKAYADGGRYIYTPYGSDAFKGTAQEVSMSGNPYRYTGRRLDAQTGLYYYRARYYDSETGRFLQTDPIGTDDQMNVYAYVGNSPLNATDPTGMSCNNSLGKCPGDPGPRYPDNYNTTDWDEVQAGLDVAGFAGPLGPAADGLNTLISFARGNFKEAGYNLIAIVPVIGDGVKGTRMAAKAADKANVRKGLRKPETLQDQMAMDAAKTGQGDVIMENLDDANFKGWQKVEVRVDSAQGNTTKIHYNRNPGTGETGQFKVKQSSRDKTRGGADKEPETVPSGETRY